MQTVSKVLVGLSVVAFVLAIIGSFLANPIVGVCPEAFSRASNNLALIAIALAVCFKKMSVEN